jgi:nucleotide-binding universal stress UspA family protein
MAQGHLIVTDSRTRCIATVTTQSVHAESVSTLARIVDSLAAEVPIEQTVLVGRTEEVVTDLSHDATLLVLGVHGDTRLRTGLALSATTQHCINHAACPVIVIPPARRFTD